MTMIEASIKSRAREKKFEFFLYLLVLGFQKRRINPKLQKASSSYDYVLL